ncbi:MAG TPA: alpha/beta fold hydrolase [Terriglobales bacterium]|nr:alpha/beta fold hydrolase [Terriglobales bacterium]
MAVAKGRLGAAGWVLAGLGLAAVVFHYGRYDWQGYRILREYKAALAAAPAEAVATRAVSVPGGGGPTEARLYLPAGGGGGPGIVLAHGMSPEGLDEPRLVAFAQVLARNGFAVLTPQLASLADFRIDPRAITAIGDSARWLQQRLGTGPVAVLGLSFAGGLALMAAANPQFAPHIRVVISVGGYDSLGRVARFLVTGETTMPGGARVRFAPNDYGALIYVAMHPRQFFPAAEAGAAGRALQDWIHQRPQAAAAELARMSPPQRAFLQNLFAGHIAAIRPQLLAVLAADQAELAALSPAGKLAGLRVPVYLLHGSGDNVIPWTEALWLEREVPRAALRRSLITAAMDHVDPSLRGWHAALRLVLFFGAALHAAE